MLDEMGEIGMRLMRAVEQQAMAPSVLKPAVPEQVGALGRMSGGDVALAFSRLARAVRQTLALKAKITGDRRAREEGKATEQAQRAATIQRARKERQKNKVRRIVEAAIDAEPHDQSDYENLLADLDDALEDLDADFGERPFGENIIRICRDLGITPNWTQWEIEAWGLEPRVVETGGIEAGATEEAGLKWPPPSPSPDPSWPDPSLPEPARTDWSEEYRSPEYRSSEQERSRGAASERDPP